jgi:hypothetical protein
MPGEFLDRHFNVAPGLNGRVPDQSSLPNALERMWLCHPDALGKRTASHTVHFEAQALEHTHNFFSPEPGKSRPENKKAVLIAQNGLL